MLWDVLVTELASNDWCTKMTNELVFKIFLNEESVNVTEQVVDLRNLQTEFDRNLDSNFVNREVLLIITTIDII